MKRFTALILTLIIFSLLLTSCKKQDEVPTPETEVEKPSENVNIDDSFSIDGKPVYPQVLEPSKLFYDDGMDLVFRFAVDKFTYDILGRSFEDFKMEAKYKEYDESTPLTYENGNTAKIISTGEKQFSGEDYYTFEVHVEDIDGAHYHTLYECSAYFSFSNLKGEYHVPAQSNSEIISSAYFAAFNDYTDRSAVETEVYKYSVGDGTYSPYSNLGDRLSVLSTALYLNIADGELTNLTQNKYYDSIYNVTYFDDILKVEMKNGSPINLNIFKHLFINGKDTYFELYEGKIKLVVK